MSLHVKIISSYASWGINFLYLYILQKYLSMCISFAIVVSSSTEDPIIEERDGLMVPSANICPKTN